MPLLELNDTCLIYNSVHLNNN